MKEDLIKNLRFVLSNGRVACSPDEKARSLIEGFQKQKQVFASLIRNNPPENKIQVFLEENPVILLHAMLDGFYPIASPRSALFAKVQLGSEYEADFVYCSGNSLGTYWTFIELERCNVPLFNKKGDQSKYLSHALRQVLNWQSWLADHSEYALDRLMNLIEESGMDWT